MTGTEWWEGGAGGWGAVAGPVSEGLQLRVQQQSPLLPPTPRPAPRLLTGSSHLHGRFIQLSLFSIFACYLSGIFVPGFRSDLRVRSFNKAENGLRCQVRVLWIGIVMPIRIRIGIKETMPIHMRILPQFYTSWKIFSTYIHSNASLQYISFLINGKVFLTACWSFLE